MYTKMADVPVPGFRKYWTQLKSECHAIANAYPEAVPIVQREYKVLSDIAVLTRNFFAHLRTPDMDTETISTENTLSEQEAPRKPGRPPPIVMTSTTNLIRLKYHVKGEY
jgi:hypothetical protein